MKPRQHTIVVSLLLLLAVRELPAQPRYVSSWRTDGLLFTGAAALGFAAVAANESVLAPTQEEIARLSRQSVNWFDRPATDNYSESASTTSDVFLAISIASPLLLLIDQEVRRDWRTFSLMYVETMALATLLPAYAKGSSKRLRPYAFNPDVPLAVKLAKDARRSFFSGHTTVAFASAAFLSTLYNEYFHPHSQFSIWAGTLMTATLVGYLRFEAGAHYPTDVIVGALVGAAVGTIIPLIHRQKVDQQAQPIAPLSPRIHLTFHFPL